MVRISKCAHASLDVAVGDNEPATKRTKRADSGGRVAAASDPGTEQEDAHAASPNEGTEAPELTATPVTGAEGRLNKHERTSATVGTASGGPTPTSRNTASNAAEPHAAHGDKQVHLCLDDSQEWTFGATDVARLATLQPGQVMALRFSPTQRALVDVPLVSSDALRLVPDGAVDASAPASPTLTAQSFQKCTVCVDTFPLDDYPSLAACQHETNICQGCFANWVAEQLNETAWDKIECLSSERSTRLTHDDVRPNVSEVFSR